MVEQTHAHHERPTQVPNVATDAIVLKPKEGGIHDILLITRGNDPFKGHLAFPGGFVDYNEDPEVACLRELKEECHIEGSHPVLVTVAGSPDRDPRKHVISIVYYVKVDSTEVKAGDDASKAEWYDLKQVVANSDGHHNLAFDHREILTQFLHKLQPQYI